MQNQYFFDPIQILYGANKSVVKEPVLILNREIKAFGEEARAQAKKLGITSNKAENLLLAPCLVDPHSVLEEPLIGKTENIQTLKKKAAHSGYGQIALLPRSPSWRDNPEKILKLPPNQSEVIFHFWGGFSQSGKGKELASHAELISHGAIGLAEDDLMMPIELIQRGLLVGEMKDFPVLLAPRDINVQGKGLVRESVETLRAGWHPDPIASETLPLSQLLELQKQHPSKSIRIMNISTAEGVSLLTQTVKSPLASVCWWHLIADNSSINSHDLGWRVTPSIGSAKDRKALQEGLLRKTISSVAVHAIPLDEEEIELPNDQRQPGLSGHDLVLPSLWQELVVQSGWSIEQLWNALSFGPSKMLKVKQEILNLNSKRWLIFDPQRTWINNPPKEKYPKVANQPLLGSKILGKVIDCGLIDLMN